MIKDEFDVALSFAGEDRVYVEKVASVLKEMGFRVFYDKYEKISLWGKDLFEHLSEVYKKRAKYTVMFISKHYKKKVWTNHERKSAQARAFKSRKEYILPARFDKTEIPGVLETVGYVNLNGTKPEMLADMIKEKIGPVERSNFFPQNPDELFLFLKAKSKKEKEQIHDLAMVLFENMKLMTNIERQVLMCATVNACADSFPDNIHLNVEYFERNSNISKKQIIAIFSRLECLGIHATVSREKSCEKGSLRKFNEIIKIKYKPALVRYEPDFNATYIIHGIFGCLDDNLCPTCRIAVLSRMDFSFLSTKAGFPEKKSIK